MQGQPGRTACCTARGILHHTLQLQTAVACPAPPPTHTHTHLHQEAVEHLAAAKGHLLEGGSGGELFYSDNRAGIPGTLHRISAMRDRAGGIVGGWREALL